MKNIKFLDNPQDYNPNNAFVVHFSNVSSKNELLNKYSEKLLFPDYFGFNWDALCDCLRDLSWIEQKEIVIIHDDLPKLTDEELKVYIEVLIHSVQDWKKEDEHTLEVAFPESSEKQIKTCMQK